MRPVAYTGAEPAVLGATDGPQFIGPKGEHFVATQSVVGSMTFPNYLRAMRRPDLALDERFSAAERRLANYDALHEIIQLSIYSFPEIELLEAQLDEAKIAVGVVRSLKEIAETDWAKYWARSAICLAGWAALTACPGTPGIFFRKHPG